MICPSGKIAYQSKRDAKAAKRSCQDRAASEGPGTNRHEQRIYHCTCGAYHLTSHPHPVWDAA